MRFALPAALLAGAARLRPGPAEVLLEETPHIRPEPLGEPTKNADAGSILFGTLWCGKGHLLWHHNVVDGREISGTNARSFGELSTENPHLDSCCRMHDYCPWYSEEGSERARCASDEHVDAWRNLRTHTLALDLKDADWSAVAAPFLVDGPLPGFVEYNQCGRIEEIGGDTPVFGSGCECDAAFLQCLNSVSHTLPKEAHSASFIREVYFHTAIAVAIPVGPLSKLLTTNVDRACIAHQDDGHFVRDLRTDRFRCTCSGGCGAGAGEDRAWCYTLDSCGGPGMMGHWDFCDKFCFESPALCRGYAERWVSLEGDSTPFSIKTESVYAA